MEAVPAGDGFTHISHTLWNRHLNNLGIWNLYSLMVEIMKSRDSLLAEKVELDDKFLPARCRPSVRCCARTPTVSGVTVYIFQYVSGMFFFSLTVSACSQKLVQIEIWAKLWWLPCNCYPVIIEHASHKVWHVMIETLITIFHHMAQNLFLLDKRPGDSTYWRSSQYCRCQWPVIATYKEPVHQQPHAVLTWYWPDVNMYLPYHSLCTLSDYQYQLHVLRYKWVDWSTEHDVISVVCQPTHIVPGNNADWDTMKLTGPQTLADKRWVGPVKILCIIMFEISKIRPKSILGLVKAQKFSLCLTMPHNYQMGQCWYVLQLTGLRYSCWIFINHTWLALLFQSTCTHIYGQVLSYSYEDWPEY